MVVQHNLTAMNANRYLGINNSKLSKSLEKLSSGYAINRAGDNAAGLAVSEKMRSQIAGMTQGVKNAQDGISMVQTFEGALTETHSILQRMKTLADQMANGSYDDPVDRAASQREFLQLNDELNHIADTDFNGVIVLNGGKMADGLQQVDGKFDYANKADQVAAENSEKLVALQAEAQSKIDAANKAVAAAQKRLNNTKVDLSNAGAAKEWNTVDNNGYDKAEAAKIFGTEGAGDGLLSAADTAKNLADLGATEVTVTFVYDKDAGTWTGLKASAVDGNGETIEVDKSSVEKMVCPDNKISTGNTGLGGFNVVAPDGTTTTSVNAIFDSTAAKTGDTVTLTFTNSASKTVAPKNMGMDANSYDDSEIKGVKPATLPTFAINVTDAQMTDEIKDALNTLDQSYVKVSYTGKTPSYELMDENDAALASNFKIDDNGEITYKTSEGKTISLATVSAGAGGEKTDSTFTAPTAEDNQTRPTGGSKGGSVTVTWNGTKWEDESGNAVTTVDVGSKTGLTIPTATAGAGPKPLNKGDKLTISMAVSDGTTNGTDKYTYTVKLDAQESTSGSAKFGLAIEHGDYDTTGGYTVKAGKDTDINSENAVLAQKALDKAKAELKAAKDAYPTKLSSGVSTSDAFNKSEAKLTYKDNITLQVGARTKDAVNFTFTYDSDVIGDLKGDLDCTAAGLGTDKLTIATQEDANYAIDKIDQAINKVSLIRGNFGAIQNRLEHKIDNMNVSIENLTDAESKIRDTDMATEMMNFTKQQILAQASQSMLAQANQLPQGVLSLLQ